MPGDEQPLCRFLEWDTAFFGCRVARVVPERLDAAGAKAVLAWARAERIACLYFLADTADAASLAVAEDHGFRCVDIRVTLDREVERRPTEAGEAGGPAVRPGRASDLDALVPIARGAHTDTRFFADPHFERERCAALYETWLRQGFSGGAEAVLVFEHEGRAAGYVSCHLRSAGEGQIGLLGVGAQARGRGGGRGLVRAALRWFGAQGCRQVSVVTQGRNIPAQRLYQGCGFKTGRAQAWHHLWMADLDRKV
ncbi:MAG: GNAT family N-acetyltransferase [Kiritimatiellae bacterium]|nr:GNAT family N-acetyltransferase [Kiritimatiellia bacterium]